MQPGVRRWNGLPRTKFWSKPARRRGSWLVVYQFKQRDFFYGSTTPCLAVGFLHYEFDSRTEKYLHGIQICSMSGVDITCDLFFKLTPSFHKSCIVGPFTIKIHMHKHPNPKELSAGYTTICFVRGSKPRPLLQLSIA